jgi:long-chain acyl-CoA synthetase
VPLPALQTKKAMLAELFKTGKEEKLKGFEMIKGVTLEAAQFSEKEDLMTPSLKLKRPQLQAKYQKEIDEMYAKIKAKA